MTVSTFLPIEVVELIWILTFEGYVGGVEAEVAKILYIRTPPKVAIHQKST